MIKNKGWLTNYTGFQLESPQAEASDFFLHKPQSPSFNTQLWSLFCLPAKLKIQGRMIVEENHGETQPGIQFNIKFISVDQLVPNPKGYLTT